MRPGLLASIDADEAVGIRAYCVKEPGTFATVSTQASVISVHCRERTLPACPGWERAEPKPVVRLEFSTIRRSKMLFVVCW
jgi:hypothetical protein